MTKTQIIGHYESLAALSDLMREASEKGEWDKLIELEQKYLHTIAELKLLDDIDDLDEASRLRKVELIRKLLANDTEIRKRTQSWLDQLQRNMQSNRQEQRLNRTYGAM